MRAGGAGGEPWSVGVWGLWSKCRRSRSQCLSGRQLVVVCRRVTVGGAVPAVATGGRREPLDGGSYQGDQVRSPWTSDWSRMMAGPRGEAVCK